MTVQKMMKDSYGKNLIKAFRKVITDKANLAGEKNWTKSVPAAHHNEMYEQAFKWERDFFESTGYLYQEIGRNISRMSIEDESFRAFVATCRE